MRRVVCILDICICIYIYIYMQLKRLLCSISFDDTTWVAICTCFNHPTQTPPSCKVLVPTAGRCHLQSQLPTPPLWDGLFHVYHAKYMQISTGNYQGQVENCITAKPRAEPSAKPSGKPLKSVWIQTARNQT